MAGWWPCAGVVVTELTRRAVLTRGAGLMAGVIGLNAFGVIGQGATVAEAATPTTAQTNANRAGAAFNAMQKNFFVQDGKSFYPQTFPSTYPRSGNPYSYLWEFSRALVGTFALAGVPSNLIGGTSYVSAVQNRLNGLANYWNPQANA